MALQVIGAGWGRTGTESLKLALEELGFGKCYHMFELIRDHSRFPYWLQLEKGEIPDYEKLFDGYRSAVDFPAALYYREFMKQYPEARVILSIRDADAWYTSASKTILKGFPPFLILFSRLFGPFVKSLRNLPEAKRWIDRILNNGLWLGKTGDRETMKKIFHEWNEEVKRTVPAEKLLVFDVQEGWEPLCRFLKVPVPETPFPKANTGEKFRKKTSRMLVSGNPGSPDNT